MEDIGAQKEKAKKFKMILLYIQTKELYSDFEKDMEYSPKRYYLVDKIWLDNFKIKHAYNEIVQSIKNDLEYEHDYFDIKVKLNEELNIDSNQLTTIGVEDLIENVLSSEEDFLPKYNINIPKNRELINENYFEDCFRKKNFSGFKLCQVHVGNKTILIIDEEKKKNIYCCSLVPYEENNYNFLVKIEYILFFKSVEIQRKQIDELINEKGLENYLRNRNINVMKKSQMMYLD